MTDRPQALPINFGGIPANLQTIARWVMWKHDLVKDRWTKVPYQVNGRKASTSNSNTWNTFNAVADEICLNPDFDGIGLVIDGTDFHGIDLDDCRDPDTGDLSPLALETLERVEGYAEVSPSGTGIKMFTPTNLKRSRTKKDAGVELYTDGRYFAVTGHQINGHSDMAETCQDMSWFVQQVWQEDPSSALINISDPSAPITTGTALMTLDDYKPALSGWDLARVEQEIMPHLDPDAGYAEWLSIGAVLHHQGEGAQEWLALWDAWSATSDKYTDGICELKWGSFKAQRAGGAMTLATLIKKTKEIRSLLNLSIGLDSIASAPRGFAFIQASKLLSESLEPQYLIENLIEDGSLGALIGATGTYKSFLAIDWAACCSLGISWNQLKVKQGTVFFIAGEGRSGFKRRLKAWEIGTGLSLGEAPLFFSENAASLMEQESLFSVVKSIDELQTHHGKPSLIVIDTLHRNMGPGDENSAKDMATLINNIDHLRKKFSCTLLLIHHVGHSINDRSRGSSSLKAALDFEFLMKKNGDQVLLESTKSKEAALTESLAFKPKEIDLPFSDKDLRTARSLILEQETAVIKKIVKPLSGGMKIAFDALKRSVEKIEQEKPLFPADSIVAVCIDNWKSEAFSSGISDSKVERSRHKAFNRARSELINRGIVICKNDEYSIVG